MKVFKFGGASVKDAEAVVNLKNILNKYTDERLVIVVSAMGKTTNALEKVVYQYFYKDQDFDASLNDILEEHLHIMNQLFTKDHDVFDEIRNLFSNIQGELIELKRNNATLNFIYDQIVSVGEIVSTKIVSAYLNSQAWNNVWVDSRGLIKTDDTYGQAKVDWALTEQACNAELNKEGSASVVTQGFIGLGKGGYTTTLGREGSDFSAAIIANVLDAKEVIIWKDVPGILNADPKYFNGAKKLDNISYHEAVELAYYGATIIHPKTIKPLQNKNIPLLVNSFVDPENQGSIVNNDFSDDSLIPSYIFRVNQVLISISPRDYSFIVEENLSDIFGLFASKGIKINLMQNSAISFSVCIDHDKEKVSELISELKNTYKVLYNDKLELLTVRHYDQETIDQLTSHKKVLVEQKSRHTARLVMKSNMLS